MDNDILRVENFKEEELNSSHFKNSVEENKSKSAKNSIASFIRDEKNNKAKDSEALTEKPKLINSLFLAVAFIAFDVISAARSIIARMSRVLTFTSKVESLGITFL